MAADDFQAFKKMMMQRNRQLSYENLKRLQRMQIAAGLSSSPPQPPQTYAHISLQSHLISSLFSYHAILYISAQADALPVRIWPAHHIPVHTAHSFGAACTCR